MFPLPWFRIHLNHPRFYVLHECSSGILNKSNVKLQVLLANPHHSIVAGPGPLFL